MRRRLRAARVPEEGGSRPARIFSSVDLPEPFGPTRPTWSSSKTPSDKALEERRRAEGLGELLTGNEQLSQRGLLRARFLDHASRLMLVCARRPRQLDPLAILSG
jgi:hypothetical protein